jgi:hypothetical protein
MVFPTSGPDDVLGHVLGCQRLEPFVDLFRGLFVTPETGDGEGCPCRIVRERVSFHTCKPGRPVFIPGFDLGEGIRQGNTRRLTSLYHPRLNFRHPDRRIIQFLHHGHGKPPQGMLGSAVDRPAGISFSTGDGAELDDVAGVVLFEVCGVTMRSVGGRVLG